MQRYEMGSFKRKLATTMYKALTISGALHALISLTPISPPETNPFTAVLSLSPLYR